MTLDETERTLQLTVPVGGMDDKDLVRIKQQLENDGFVVTIIEESGDFEPRLATDVGLFVGVRSIAGFARQFRRYFAVAHATAKALAG